MALARHGQTKKPLLVYPNLHSVFVLPTLPMFLVLPALLRNGLAFWSALAVSCVLTVSLYVLTAWLLSKGGYCLVSVIG